MDRSAIAQNYRKRYVLKKKILIDKEILVLLAGESEEKNEIVGIIESHLQNSDEFFVLGGDVWEIVAYIAKNHSLHGARKFLRLISSIFSEIIEAGTDMQMQALQYAEEYQMDVESSLTAVVAESLNIREVISMNKTLDKIGSLNRINYKTKK